MATLWMILGCFYLFLTDVVFCQSLCPEVQQHCMCYYSHPNQTRAECGGEDLTYIPGSFLPNLTHLHINGANLGHITAENLTRYTDLQIIELIDSQITGIDADSLQGLVELISFNGSNNNISTIPNGLFTGLVKLTYLNLQYNHITDIPINMDLEQLTSFVMSDNFVTEIPGEIFINCPHLTEIHLSMNEIKDIALDAFKTLTDLIVLNLANNKIETIGHTTFDYLGNLERLYLSNNKIEVIPDNSFEDTPLLLQLFLGNNKVSHLSDTAFDGMTRLSFLAFQGNEFTSVPSDGLVKLTGLTHLFLQSNPINSVDANAFLTLINLEELVLGSTPLLFELHQEAFAGLKNLTSLTVSDAPNLTILTPEHLPDSDYSHLYFIYFSNNGFTHLSEYIFVNKPTLIEVDIHGNPFHCDCQLEWMPRLIDEGVSWAVDWKDSGTPPRCFTPDTLYNFKIPNMLVQDMTCEPAVISLISPQTQVAYLHGNATFQAALTNGLPASLWIIPDGTSYKPIRANPTNDVRAMSEAKSTYDGNPTDPDRRFKVREDLDEDHRVIATIDLDNATLSDVGDYTLIAANVEGNTTQIFTLEVLPYELTTAPTSPIPSGASHPVITQSLVVLLCGFTAYVIV